MGIGIAFASRFPEGHSDYIKRTGHPEEAEQEKARLEQQDEWAGKFVDYRCSDKPQENVEQSCWENAGLRADFDWASISNTMNDIEIP